MLRPLNFGNDRRRGWTLHKVLTVLDRNRLNRFKLGSVRFEFKIGTLEALVTILVLKPIYKPQKVCSSIGKVGKLNNCT